ncbi:fatty-acid amide hydrolase 1-like isoform X1, partial [Biomphalaria pfeifferi]
MVFHYIMPIKAIEIYLSYIHSKLLYVPEQYRKRFVAAIFLLYLIHLGVQHINFLANLWKIRKRKQSLKQRCDSLTHKLKDVKNSPNMLLPYMTLHDLSNEIQDSILMPEMVINAFQQQALNCNKHLNGIADFIPLDLKEFEKRTSVKKESIAITIAVKETNLLAAPPTTSESIFYQMYTKLFSCFSNKESECSSKNLSVQGKSLSLKELQNIRRYSVYGIPISLTEIIHVKSQDSTAGLSLNLNVMVKDAVIVKVLKSQGAIPFIRTNVPQIGLQSFASSNPIYGTTVHPFVAGRSPGGGSSGEGSLLACKGSILGVGTDISGGIRIPAHFCGVCGFKPTSCRMSHKGLTVLSGQEKIPICVGPLSRNVEGLVRFMHATCVPLHFELDCRVTPLAFDEVQYESNRLLQIGYFIEDSCTKSTPAVERAVLLAKTLLEARGHKVVNFDPPDLKMMLTKLFLPALLGSNSQDIHCYLYTDKVDSSLRSSFYTPFTHYPVRFLFSFFYRFMNNPIDADLMAIKYPETVTDWWNLMKNIGDFKLRFMKKWKEAKIDALLCPVLPFAALKLGNEKYFTGCLTFATLFNVLDFPAGCVPVAEVEKSDNENLKNSMKYKVSTKLERLIVEDQLDPKITNIGLPLGVQIAALPFYDELVLRVMRELEEAVQ